MRRISFLFFCVAFFVIANNTIFAPMVWSQERLSIYAELFLKVVDNDSTATLLLNAAEQRAGYLSAQNNTQLTLKIPSSEVDAFLNLAKMQGELLDENFIARNIANQFDQTNARLQSRENLLAKLSELKTGNDISEVVAVEAEIIAVVAEIEQLQARLANLNNELAYAQILINFRNANDNIDNNVAPSPFPWLNRVGLPDLISDFK